jgi:hypothetical protein
MILEQVISGGQTGVDQVALQIAWEMGYRTGGMAPLGYKTDAGPNPALLRDFYGLTECTFAGYRIRSHNNVQTADSTVWFGQHRSPGWLCTIGECQRRNRPFLINPTAVELRAFLEKQPIRILNVAGHRMRTHPEAAAYAGACLALALEDHSQRPLRLHAQAKQA